MKTLEGHTAAESESMTLAREPDGWMTPTTDEPNDPVAKTDFGRWLQGEIAGWEQTDHFSMLYAPRISDLARDVADANGLEEEAWLGVYEDLQDAFWNAWADKHQADRHWARHIAARPRVSRSRSAKEDP